MKQIFTVLACIVGVLTSAYILATVEIAQPVALTREAAMQPNPRIKNIILMIPDGASIGGITLARWYKSYDPKTGTVDPTVTLAMDELASGLVRTWWAGQGVIGAITDSAPAATAMASGIKTLPGRIGVDENDAPIKTILQAAKERGKATGLIATSNIQHATPAAFSAHHYDRRRYDIIGEHQIAIGIDVVMGGGSRHIDIESVKAAGYQYITTREELMNLRAPATRSLLSRRSATKADGEGWWAMFAPDAMAYDFDRADSCHLAGRERLGLATEDLNNSWVGVTDNCAIPSLAEMTKKSIELLSRNRRGFFLMVEGSKPDWAAHANDPVGLVSEILAFDSAVQVALDFAKSRRDTMLIIVSDHGTGGITIGNYDTDKTYFIEPVERFVAPLRRARRTGAAIAAHLNADRTNIERVLRIFYGIDDLSQDEIRQIRAADVKDMARTVGPMMSRRAGLGWTTHGHTGEDVVLFTYLPNNGRIVGTLDNTDIARIIAGIWRLNLPQLKK